MSIGTFRRCTCACLLAMAGAAPAAAQIVEAVGSRAQGMGGAFVAVANDSSATWWNPAGLAEGPFFDMALARSSTDVTTPAGEQENRTSWFALGTPPFGFSYYGLRIRDIRPSSPTAGGDAGRQEGGAGAPVRALAASQLGVTLPQTLLPGVHAGTTLKYVRGAVDAGATEHAFDFDVGLLAVAGPVRLGAVGRNLRALEFDAGAFTLPRQVRVGAAFDAAQAGGPPLTIAVDADVQAYEIAGGERRVVALGAEQWLLARRLALRVGVRVNTVGTEERSGTVGVSVSPRAGLYLDGFAAAGGSADDRGWGLAARVSF